MLRHGMAQERAELKRSIAFFLASVLMLGVLAGCSVFGKPDMYREARFCDEDGEYTGSDFYGAEGEYLASSGNDEELKYRITDRSRQLDTSEVAAMEGVVKVECRQVFVDEEGSGSDMSETPFVFMRGCNRFGKPCVTRVYQFLDNDWDHPVLSYETVYETDSNGNPTHLVQKSTSGDVVEEHWYENIYSGKRILSSEVSIIRYGYVFGTEFTANDTPQNSRSRVDYIY